MLSCQRVRLALTKELVDLLSLVYFVVFTENVCDTEGPEAVGIVYLEYAEVALHGLAEVVLLLEDISSDCDTL